MNRTMRGAAAVLFALSASCTSVDDKTGAGFIPDDQYFDIEIDSSLVIKGYNILPDPVRADDNSTAWLGSYVDDKTGSADASLIFQMGMPFFGSEASNSYGPDVAIDSLSMIFSVEGWVGKEDVPQTFEVYRLREDIYADTVYYTGFDPSTVIESEPWFSFDYKYDPNTTYMIQKIFDHDLIEELSDTTGFFDNDRFHKRFKGFYIKAKESGRDAAVFNLNLTNSYMMAYFRRSDADTVTNGTLFMFSNTASHFTSKNQNIQIAEYDYSDADPALMINDTENAPATTFVQGYGGLATLLEFSEESVQAIRDRVAAAGYSQTAVNKALLQIPITRRSQKDLDSALGRLGMFSNYYDYTPILDYDYQSEQTYGYTIPYGGRLNGAKDMYEMDITRYVQSLLSGNAPTTKITLAPDMDQLYTLEYTELNSRTSDDPLRLVITYSMVK